MHYVYVLLSTKLNKIYVGFTSNLRNRFELHNSGRVKSTKSGRPWILVYYEAYVGKLDATKREKELKLHTAKKILLSHLKNSLTKFENNN
jgi:putative endonuclease